MRVHIVLREGVIIIVNDSVNASSDISVSTETCQELYI